MLLANAVLWLLDEPTTNLDADGQQLVRDLIGEQLARDGIVVAAVHHALALPAEQLVALELGIMKDSHEDVASGSGPAGGRA